MKFVFTETRCLNPTRVFILNASNIYDALRKFGIDEKCRPWSNLSHCYDDEVYSVRAVKDIEPSFIVHRA